MHECDIIHTLRAAPILPSMSVTVRISHDKSLAVGVGVEVGEPNHHVAIHAETMKDENKRHRFCVRIARWDVQRICSAHPAAFDDIGQVISVGFLRRSRTKLSLSLRCRLALNPYRSLIRAG